jgi:hypothetical protein
MKQGGWRIRGSLVGLLVLAACGQGGDGLVGTPDAAGEEVGGDTEAEATSDAPDAMAPRSWPIFRPGEPGFLTTPFPSDALRTAGGGLDLQAFPNPEGLALVNDYVAAASRLHGFSVAQVVYVAFEGPIDVAGLPPWLPGGADQPVQLVDVTPGPDLGRRVPLAWRWAADASLYLPPHVLAVRPLPGVTLTPGHAYAALVTTALPATPPLAAPAAFVEALAGGGPSGPSLAPLAAWLAAQPELAGRVVVATVFTVDDPLSDLRRIRKALWEGPAPTGLRGFKLAGSSPDWHLYDAEYDAPEFLAGEAPYAREGGGFEFDADGEPVVQRTVTLRLSISVPRQGTMPPDGWPLALTAHGTLGYFHSFAFSTERDTAAALGREGVAGTGLDQPLHGPRSPTSLSDELLELYSFNFQNPDAGRTVQRQSVADQIYLLRLLHEGQLVVPASVSRRGVDERFDPSRVLFFGHSQGGVTGALLLGVEDRLRGGVLSAAGGGLTASIMLRTDPLSFRLLVAALLHVGDPADLDEFHPAMALLQLLVDAVDPLAYAPHWREFDANDPLAQPRSVLLTEGMDDAYTPPPTAEALAVAGGLPALAPAASWGVAAEALGLAPVPAPVTGNLQSGGRAVTGALAQYPGFGHYAVYESDLAYQTYGAFLGSLCDGPGVVDPPGDATTAPHP